MSSPPDLRKMNVFSLRRRMMALIGAPLIAALLIVGMISSAIAWHEVRENYDGEMVHFAHMLDRLAIEGIEAQAPLPGLRASPRWPGEGKEILFRVMRSGRIVAQSDKADSLPATPLVPGFSDRRLDRAEWRLYCYYDRDAGLTVEVGNRLSERGEVVSHIMLSFIGTILALLPLSLLITWIGATHALMPLVDLSASVDKRDMRDLTPIDFSSVAAEIVPLVKSLDRLFDRMRETLAQERELTDNAAHELRTPLAAIRMTVQNLLHGSDLAPQDRENIEDVLAAIGRASALVEQILSFARLQNADMKFGRVDLARIVQMAVSELQSLAQGKSIRIDFTPIGLASLIGNDEALFILVRNLVDNAVKFTPPGGAVSVEIEQRAGIFLRVRDTGPGIADVDKPLVFRRFYRQHKNRADGSGIGLSVVQWIAGVHKASIALSDNTPGGLIVTVEFPDSAL